MDFFNNLLTSAAGYFGDKNKQDAQLQLAQLGVGQTATAAATAAAAPAAPAASAQWVPGVSNGVVIAAGAGLLLLTVVLVARK